MSPALAGEPPGKPILYFSRFGTCSSGKKIPDFLPPFSNWISSWTCQVQFTSVQSLSHVWLFATPWTAVHQASLSITNSRSLLKLMSIESVMTSNHFILCCPLILPLSIPPSIRVFSSESVFHIMWPKYWNFSSTSVLPMNTWNWSPLGWTDWISLQSKGLSVFSKPQFKSINSLALKNVSNINAKLWKNNHKWKLQLLKCMGTNYWSDDMLNKKKATCLDKGKSFKVINMHVFIFLLYTGSCGRVYHLNKLQGVTMPCSARCVMSPCSLINFCQIKTRAPSPAWDTGMCNANMECY